MNCPVCGKGKYQLLDGIDGPIENPTQPVSHLACVARLVTQIDLVRQSFDTTYPGLGDPFKLRAHYDEMTVELAALKGRVKRVLEVGHNDDCLFCALKDTAALGGREAAAAYARAEEGSK